MNLGVHLLKIASLVSIMDIKNYHIENDLHKIPVCPDSGEPMIDITGEMVDIPSNVEIWESNDSRSLFIRQNRYSKPGLSDYTAEELEDVRIIARSLIT